MEHADEPLHLCRVDVFDHTSLMTQGDASEELGHHQLVDVERTREDHVRGLVVVLGRELQLVGKVVKRIVLLEGVVG